MSKYDVFVSHASEDKDVVLPLVHALNRRKVTTWYDDHQLQVGDRLRASLDQAIYKSRFAVVFLSISYLEKTWTQYELDGIISLENNRQVILLPIWHEVSKLDLQKYSPSIVDRIALNTSYHSIEKIADEIHSKIHGNPSLGNDELSSLILIMSNSDIANFKFSKVKSLYDKLEAIDGSDDFELANLLWLCLFYEYSKARSVSQQLRDKFRKRLVFLQRNKPSNSDIRRLSQVRVYTKQARMLLGRKQ